MSDDFKGPGLKVDILNDTIHIEMCRGTQFSHSHSAKPRSNLFTSHPLFNFTNMFLYHSSILNFIVINIVHIYDMDILYCFSFLKEFYMKYTNQGGLLC